MRPSGLYDLLRDNLGSIRKVYGGRRAVHRHGDLGNTQKEHVLLLHGFMQTRAVWEVMEDRLRFDGYTVFSFDLGGLLRRSLRGVRALVVGLIWGWNPLRIIVAATVHVAASAVSSLHVALRLRALQGSLRADQLKASLPAGGVDEYEYEYEYECDDSGSFNAIPPWFGGEANGGALRTRGGARGRGSRRQQQQPRSTVPPRPVGSALFTSTPSSLVVRPSDDCESSNRRSSSDLSSPYFFARLSR